MNYRTISDMNGLLLKRLYILPRDFDLIVGIPRSGMLPANLLALYLNKPYTDIDSFVQGRVYKAGARGDFFDTQKNAKILVVDDSVASGSALQKSKDKLAPLASAFDIKYCAVYVVPEKKSLVDYYFELLPVPRIFQWNVLNHTILEKSCFDIDGVLCLDPTDKVNDDGERYLNFILNAPVLFVPGSKIGTIVTSRLEKYRAATEHWLRVNNVKYNKLVMCDLPTIKARQSANNHAIGKAKEYAKNEYQLFVESSLAQAVEINRLTGKPVLCTENFEMIFGSQSLYYNLKSGRTLPFIRKALFSIRRTLVRLHVR